jgi:peroxiredoxin
MTPLLVGEPAPDLRLRDPQEDEVRLSALWAEAPLVVIFLRHFG